MAVRARLAPHLGLAAEGAATPACRDVVEIFSRRLEGEIDGSACAELEGHLVDCPTCRGRCETLRAALTMCRRAGEASVPPSVERQVRVALQAFLDRR
jgi:RNA polymerase sigma-70 factor, ECF subfamily